MVVAWNFGYPQASPLEDVIVAVILSLFNFRSRIIIVSTIISFERVVVLTDARDGSKVVIDEGKTGIFIPMNLGRRNLYNF